MEKDDFIYIEDILNAFSKILLYTKDISEEVFYENEMLQDAVLRKLEIAGEAAKRVSIRLKNQYPEIPWKKISGLRDKLIHDYAGVDISAIWKTINVVLPEVIHAMKSIKRS